MSWLLSLLAVFSVAVSAETPLSVDEYIRTLKNIEKHSDRLNFLMEKQIPQIYSTRELHRLTDAVDHQIYRALMTENGPGWMEILVKRMRGATTEDARRFRILLGAEVRGGALYFGRPSWIRWLSYQPKSTLVRITNGLSQVWFGSQTLHVIDGNVSQKFEFGMRLKLRDLKEPQLKFKLDGRGFDSQSNLVYSWEELTKNWKDLYEKGAIHVLGDLAGHELNRDSLVEHLQLANSFVMKPDLDGVIMAGIFGYQAELLEPLLYSLYTLHFHARQSPGYAVISRQAAIVGLYRLEMELSKEESEVLQESADALIWENPGLLELYQDTMAHHTENTGEIIFHELLESNDARERAKAIEEFHKVPFHLGTALKIQDLALGRNGARSSLLSSSERRDLLHVLMAMEEFRDTAFSQMIEVLDEADVSDAQVAEDISGVLFGELYDSEWQTRLMGLRSVDQPAVFSGRVNVLAYSAYLYSGKRPALVRILEADAQGPEDVAEAALLFAARNRDHAVLSPTLRKVAEERLRQSVNRDNREFLRSLTRYLREDSTPLENSLSRAVGRCEKAMMGQVAKGRSK